MVEKDPPEPQNPLQLFIDKLSSTIASITSLTRKSIELLRQIDRKQDAMLSMLSDSRTSDQVVAERLKSLLSLARTDEEDRREIRRLLTELSSRMIETGFDIKETRREITGQHDLHELNQSPPSGLHKGGFNLTWRMIGRGALKALPAIVGWLAAIGYIIWDQMKGHHG